MDPEIEKRIKAKLDDAQKSDETALAAHEADREDAKTHRERVAEEYRLYEAGLQGISGFFSRNRDRDVVAVSGPADRPPFSTFNLNWGDPVVFRGLVLMLKGKSETQHFYLASTTGDVVSLRYLSRHPASNGFRNGPLVTITLEQTPENADKLSEFLINDYLAREGY